MIFKSNPANNFVLFIFLLMMVCGQNAFAQRKAWNPPNIIFFLVDDMGWQDTSVPFWDSVMAANRKFRTPNMEELAACSMKFTNAYANSICTPSRVSLMSEMSPPAFLRLWQCRR